MAMEVSNQELNLNLEPLESKLDSDDPIIIIHDDDDEDGHKLSATKGTTKMDPITVADDRNPKPQINYQVVDDYDDNDDIRVLPIKPFRSSSSKKRRWGIYTGQSSSLSLSLSLSSGSLPRKRKMFPCEICADDKFNFECFNVEGCTHSFCFDCIRSYIVSKLDNGIPQVECPVPSCHGLMEPEDCRYMLGEEVFSRWGRLLCESVIGESEKFYCPFQDCSAMLIDDGREEVTRTECPNCKRLFCARCKAAWHDGVGCDQYQKMNEDERAEEGLMLKGLAKNKKWQRCPTCKFYVERNSGCNFMMCRCRTAFCYNCGDKYFNIGPSAHACSISKR